MTDLKIKDIYLLIRKEQSVFRYYNEKLGKNIDINGVCLDVRKLGDKYINRISAVIESNADFEYSVHAKLLIEFDM